MSRPNHACPPLMHPANPVIPPACTVPSDTKWSCVSFVSWRVSRTHSAVFQICIIGPGDHLGQSISEHLFTPIQCLRRFRILSALPPHWVPLLCCYSRRSITSPSLSPCFTSCRILACDSLCCGAKIGPLALIGITTCHGAGRVLLSPSFESIAMSI